MRSMTGFGRARFELDGRTYRLEVRSLNNRFLDLRVRTPFLDAELEGLISTRVKARLSRGRVELSIVEEADAARGTGARVDTRLARELAPALAELAALLGADLRTAATLVAGVRELVRLPAGTARTEETWGVLEAALAGALDGLLEMRRLEGGSLEAELRRHADRLDALVDQLFDLARAEPDRLRRRLIERLDRLAGTVELDPGRVAQEAVLLAERADVTEELARLRSHLVQLRGALLEEECGRKVEFLLQELQRELNTIASKSASSDVAELAVDGKSALEKMREQVQNVE
jgi:uncharacterized protein (TIGR00255 family)